MNSKMHDISHTISRNEEIVDALDKMLTESSDRAYVVCSASDCRNNLKGRCTIHLVKDTRIMMGNGRCADYVT